MDVLTICNDVVAAGFSLRIYGFANLTPASAVAWRVPDIASDIHRKLDDHPW